MPFKSEKQRRYLWANEPEIARDWTDTYGSRIQKNDGGISQLVKRGPGRPGYAGPAGGASGLGNYGGDSSGGKSASEMGGGYQGPGRDNRHPSEKYGTTVTHTPKPKHKQPGDHHPPKKKWTPGQNRPFHTPKTAYDKFRDAGYKFGINRHFVNALKNMGAFGNPGFKGFAGELISGMGPVPEWAEDMTEKEIIDALTTGPYLSQQKTKGDVSAYTSGKDELSRVFEAKELLGQGKLTQSEYNRIFPNPTLTNTGGDGGQPLWMRLGYPSYEAWQAAQGGGGGGTTVAEEVVETESPFQKSLNTGITKALSPYYVGANPTAANIAWGQQFGVDPRTMYMAEGGPIRQRYFLGKIVKKIGRAAKKVIKSPIGKAALGIGALMYAPKFMGQFKAGTGFGGMFNKAGMIGKLFTGGGKGDMYDGKWNPWKLGIGAASMLPFFMGGKEEEDQDKPFDYEGAKQAYLNEIMNIKRGAMAGTLDPNQFNYLGVKDGGRIGYQGGGMEDPLLVEEYKKYVFEMEEMGLQPMSFEEFRAQAIAGMASGGRAGYYAGGQSIPSENSMEDARKTAMQDRLGGITEVMKQADLYRQGDVGQMYMAEGGPTQEAGIMDLGGVEKDYRETGGFVPIGKEEKADDVPARLSLNEFVMTADAVRGMGEGDIDKGAERMEDLMETLEVKGKRNQGASDMFEVSERLSAVV